MTRDHKITHQALVNLGAEAIKTSRLSVDEISVEILKEANHVGAQ